MMYLVAKEGREITQQTANDVDLVKRLSFPSLISVNSRPSPTFQGTNCERAFTNGSPRQTHPRIITSHAVLIIREQQAGFFREASSKNGCHLNRFFGSMENVRRSRPPRNTL
jgi:hypothetical protein